MTGATPIYHLDVRVSACRARFTLNGFPITDLDARGSPRATAPPLNPWLAGANNLLEVELWPASDTPGAYSAISLEGSVRRFQKGGVVGPGAGRLISTLELPDTVAPGAASSWPISWEFATEDAPSFAPRLHDAPAVDDEASLLARAVGLLDLVVRKDASGLVTQMKPKIEDYALAFDEPESAFEASLEEFFDNDIFPDAHVHALGSDEIRLRPHCEGRIWELYRSTGDALIRASPKPGMTCQLPIFVGDVGGSLEVVR